MELYDWQLEPLFGLEWPHDLDTGLSLEQMRMGDSDECLLINWTAMFSTELIGEGRERGMRGASLNPVTITTYGNIYLIYKAP